MKVAIVADTNSSMSKADADALGVYLVPMPFLIDGESYYENLNCSYREFFDRLREGADVSTSQPSPMDVTKVWDKALEDHDALVYLPMSSGLSSSCATAKALAADEYEGKVYVADNQRISVTQFEAIKDACAWAEDGMTAEEICKKLEATGLDSSIYLAVNTLELLKKSGRVTAAGASIATVLNIKPVLQIQGEKLDAFAKVRGMVKAEDAMLKAVKKDIEGRFAGRNVQIMVAYSGDENEAIEWRDKVADYFDTKDIIMRPLPISICCHVGEGVHAIAVAPKQR